VRRRQPLETGPVRIDSVPQPQLAGDAREPDHRAEVRARFFRRDGSGGGGEQQEHGERSHPFSSIMEDC
jgi:hypothetical protein